MRDQNSQGRAKQHWRQCVVILGIAAIVSGFVAWSASTSAATDIIEQSRPHRVVCRHRDHGYQGLATECYPSYEIASRIRNYHMQVARGHVAMTQECRSDSYPQEQYSDLLRGDFDRSGLHKLNQVESER